MGTGGRLLRWYNELAYDGVDCLILDEDLSSWTVETSTVTQISQHKSEAYLKDNCSELLQKYLEKGEERLLRSGAQGSQTLSTVPLGCLLGVWRAEGVWVGREDLKEYSSQVERLLPSKHEFWFRSLAFAKEEREAGEKESPPQVQRGKSPLCSRSVTNKKTAPLLLTRSSFSPTGDQAFSN